MTIQISTLKPSESDIDEARRFCRDEEARGYQYGDLIEAIDNALPDEDKARLLGIVKRAHTAKVKAGKASALDVLAIGAIVLTAFESAVNKWAEPNVTAYLDRYADDMAEELRERGYLVDYSV